MYQKGDFDEKFYLQKCFPVDVDFNFYFFCIYHLV